MKNLQKFFTVLLTIAGAIALADVTDPQVPRDGVHRTVGLAVVDGMINGGSGDYIRTAIEGSVAARHEALVIRLDTPGGVLDVTRDIVKAMLASEVPVIVYVAPAGSRAASAGTFITMAAHVAAMAPATNIGAAHPIMLGGGGGEDEGEENKKRKSQSEVMLEKAENDTVALIQSIAKQRGRNAEWAEKAVRESVSVTAEQAVQLKVVDLIASDLSDLLKKIDGREVKLGSGEIRKLHTANAEVMEIPMTLRQRLMMALAEPTLLAILFAVGMLGLAAEFYHPGTIVPGTLGAFCLVLALLASQVLPVNWGAALLIMGGGALLVAEMYVGGHGFMAGGGVICILIGGVLLVDPSKQNYWVAPDFRVQWTVLVPLVASLAGFFGVVAYKVVRSRALKPVTGDIGLIGETGVAETTIGPEGGKVFVHSELWNARAKTSIAAKTAVRVVRVEGLLVEVEPT
jgi:membrane-bound serine protease (ClpP class)